MQQGEAVLWLHGKTSVSTDPGPLVPWTTTRLPFDFLPFFPRAASTGPRATFRIDRCPTGERPMSKATTLITTTTALSRAVDAILASQAGDRPLNKAQILNILAGQMAGEKHNWGYLTGMDHPVLQKGLTAEAETALMGYLQERAQAATRAASAALEQASENLPKAEVEAIKSGMRTLVQLQLRTDKGRTNFIVLDDEDVLRLHEIFVFETGPKDRGINHRASRFQLISHGDTLFIDGAPDLRPSTVMNKIDRGVLAKVIADVVQEAARRLCSHETDAIVAGIREGILDVADMDPDIERAKQADIIDWDDIQDTLPVAIMITIRNATRNGIDLEKIYRDHGPHGLVSFVTDGSPDALGGLLGVYGTTGADTPKTHLSAGMFQARQRFEVLDETAFLECAMIYSHKTFSRIEDAAPALLVQPFSERDFGCKLKLATVSRLSDNTFVIEIAAEITDPVLFDRDISAAGQNNGLDHGWSPEDEETAILEAFLFCNDRPSPVDLGFQFT